jgi:hypothetical protein
MVQQAWSRTAIVWDAILLGAAVLVTIVAGAYHLNEAAARTAGTPIASYGETDGVANPATDGSVIIECMVLGDRAVPDLGERRGGLTPLLVSIPRYQIGPSTCWHDPHKRS